jgi:hypothetical protein
LFVQKTAQNNPMRGSRTAKALRRKCASSAPPVPGKCPGLVLLVSPSLWQSREPFARVIGFLKELGPVEQLEEDNKSSCTLAKGARIVSLPGDPDTVRGFSAPKLIIKDEAALSRGQGSALPTVSLSDPPQISAPAIHLT